MLGSSWTLPLCFCDVGRSNFGSIGRRPAAGHGCMIGPCGGRQLPGQGLEEQRACRVLLSLLELHLAAIRQYSRVCCCI